MTAQAQSFSRVNPGAIGGVLVAAAMGTSSIVFSEPAVADLIMLGVILGVPLLGVGRMGPATATGLVLWLLIVAHGYFSSAMAANVFPSFTHQTVTLYLVAGAVAIAMYVGRNPEPRFHLIMRYYTLGVLIACVAGFIGYFAILPDSYDLFTLYGRARGTYKDPNVLGAALAPAVVYSVWFVVRNKASRSIVSAAVAAFLMFALLLTFSRGAWIQTALALAVGLWLALVTSPQKRDVVRFAVLSGLGLMALFAAGIAVLQSPKMSDALQDRASLTQSYDVGPDGRFGGQAKAKLLILENPFGIGTHTFRDIHHHEAPHNVYLTTFLNAGWFGGIVYIASLLMTLVIGFEGIRRGGPLRPALIIVTASFVGVTFEGFVIDSDHWRHFYLIMGLVWGLADASYFARHDYNGAIDD